MGRHSKASGKHVSRNSYLQTEDAMTLDGPRQIPSDLEPFPGSVLLRAQGVRVNVHPLPVPGPVTESPSGRASVSPIPLSPGPPPCFQMPWVSTGESQLSSGTLELSGWVNSPLGALICNSRDQARSKQQLTGLPERESPAEARPGLPGIWSTWTGNRVCHSDTGSGEGRNISNLGSPGKLQGGGSHN